MRPMRGDHSPVIAMAVAPSASRSRCSSYRTPTFSVRLRRTFQESCAKSAMFFVVGGLSTDGATWKPAQAFAAAAEAGVPKLPVWRLPEASYFAMQFRGTFAK